MEKEGYKDIKIIVRDDKKGYVIAKINDVLYYTSNKTTTNFIPDAIIYESEDAAKHDLEKNY